MTSAPPTSIGAPSNSRPAGSLLILKSSVLTSNSNQSRRPPDASTQQLLPRKQALVRTALGIALAIGIASASRAEDAAPVRIGVLTDMSGMYRDIMGPGSLLAAQMAVKDF